MSRMEWNQSYSTGIEVFDNDHKKLVGMVNELYDAMAAGKGSRVLGPILDRLVDYTRTHFQREEAYMAEHGYPELAAHRLAHSQLTREVMTLHGKYSGGSGAQLSSDVLNFLKNWLATHILGTDKRYGAFLNSRGVY
jgi:hemerythrin